MGFLLLDLVVLKLIAHRLSKKSCGGANIQIFEIKAPCFIKILKFDRVTVTFTNSLL